MSEKAYCFISGALSRETAFWITANGPVGLKELNKLIAKLELERKIILEDENVEATDSANGLQTGTAETPEGGAK